MPQAEIAASKRTPDMTLFIEFPATYERAGTGYPLATLFRGRFAVEGDTYNRGAAAFSTAFDWLAVAITVKFSFRRDRQIIKAEKQHPFG